MSHFSVNSKKKIPLRVSEKSRRGSEEMRKNAGSFDPVADAQLLLLLQLTHAIFKKAFPLLTAAGGSGNKGSQTTITKLG